MTDKEVPPRMRFLEKEIRKHQRLYYKKHQPIISDRDFDRLYAELQSLEKSWPGIASKKSPTKIVGSDRSGEFPRFEHTIPVLSLANSYSQDEVFHWAEKICDGDKAINFVLQWKVDGVSLVLYYEKGTLIRAVTRGTGNIGDDITANARTIRDIPEHLKKKETLVVRGEVYMTYADFERFNERAGSIYANPRNTTAGSLKQKDPGETTSRPLRFDAFDAHFALSQPKTDIASLKKMKSLGLPVRTDNELCNLKTLDTTIATFEKKREKVPLPVDGLVIKVNDMNRRAQLGFTATVPRWATALKFEAEQAETSVSEIEVFVGRTGRITPRASLAPVKLAGTTVSYATLHNADFIARLDVRIGSKVRISKRGEIIPAVEEVLNPGIGLPYSFPTSCPCCKTPLVREENAADWLCPNRACSEKRISALIFFCGRKQMDIAGLGEKVIRILYERGFMQTFSDIFKLHKHAEELKSIEGFGEKSVTQMIAAIKDSMSREFRQVLPSIGLKELGRNVTDIFLEAGYHSFDAIRKLVLSADAEARLKELHGIGPRTAEVLVLQMKDRAIMAEIKALQKIGLKFEHIPKKEDDIKKFPQIFKGQIWCITGSFEQFKPREKAAHEILQRGGRVSSALGGKTTHLLNGSKGGSKLLKAQKAGLQIFTEDEFLKTIS